MNKILKIFLYLYIVAVTAACAVFATLYFVNKTPTASAMTFQQGKTLINRAYDDSSSLNSTESGSISATSALTEGEFNGDFYSADECSFILTYQKLAVNSAGSKVNTNYKSTVNGPVLEWDVDNEVSFTYRFDIIENHFISFIILDRSKETSEPHTTTMACEIWKDGDGYQMYLVSKIQLVDTQYDWYEILYVKADVEGIYEISFTSFQLIRGTSLNKTITLTDLSGSGEFQILVQNKNTGKEYSDPYNEDLAQYSTEILENINASLKDIQNINFDVFKNVTQYTNTDLLAKFYEEMHKD